jgi:hypothetical protein
MSILFLVNSCSNDTNTDDSIIDDSIDEREPVDTPSSPSTNYEQYINRFVTEAAARNIDIKAGSINFIVSDTLNFYCGWGDSRNRLVQISSRPECWIERTDIEREILMFHEIGHARLGRLHDNTKLPNGDFKTLMFDGNQIRLYTEDTPEKRTYYLDELLDPNTPIPSWATAKVNPTVIFNDSINGNASNWEYAHFGESNHSGEISTTLFSSPSSSLKISATEPTEFSYWRYAFSPEGIAQGSRLTMEVNVSLDNVTGEGVFIAIRGDSDDGMVFFETTQGTTSITGTSPFTKFTVELPYYIERTKTLNLFLIMGDNSTGTAYFDDIVITKYE